MKIRDDKDAGTKVISLKGVNADVIQGFSLWAKTKGLTMKQAIIDYMTERAISVKIIEEPVEHDEFGAPVER